MTPRSTGIFLIVLAVLLLTAAQLVIKSRLSHHGTVPFSPRELFPYIWNLLQDWRLWLGAGGLVSSAFLWYAAISRLPLSMAFPFAALSYPLILVGAVVFLREVFSLQLLFGNLLIVAGVLLVASASQG